VSEAFLAANNVRKKQDTTVVESVADLGKLLLPPRASLEVVAKAELPKVKLKATATAAVPNQPVIALRLMVDGRPLAGAAPSLFENGKAQAEADWTVTLPPGKHQLTVLVRSPDASSISPTVAIDCTPPTQRPVLHVLAVGIDDYEDKSLKLDFAAKDAQDLANAFGENGKGRLYGAVRDTRLVNDKARKESILSALSALRQRVKANDLVVFYFAGHGVKEKDQFYLLPVEAKTNDLARTALAGAELRQALGEFPCQVLLLLDACHASAGLKSFRPAVDDLTRTLTEDDCGVAVLCAAMAHEKALEKGGNGLFARAVLRALSQAEDVPFNRHDRRLYVHHLYSYVFDQVQALSDDRQHPFLSLPWVVESFPVVQFPGK
jgi:hypothetical protein